MSAYELTYGRSRLSAADRDHRNSSGLRKGELLSLKRTQVDFVRELIHVTNTKSGRDRFVPMNVVVRSELRKAAEASSADSEYLFANPTSGKPYVDIKKGFRSACDDAKIRDLRFHDLRHTFGTRLAESGARTRTIMDLMGHSQMATSARYTHATDHGKRRAVEALA
ncbi:MAG TPA: site-specific integrase [Blastocatellia bacterium]|nr:site-specific integrase [Blastocatellia bacterium]